MCSIKTMVKFAVGLAVLFYPRVRGFPAVPGRLRAIPADPGMPVGDVLWHEGNEAARRT